MKLRNSLVGLLSILVVGAVGCGGSSSGGNDGGAGKGGSGGATGAGGAGTGGGGGATGSGGATGAGGSAAGGATGAGGGSGGATGAGGAGGGNADAGRDATGDTGNRDATSGGDGSAATMTLTSTAFTEGGMFPAVNTCAGANTSPVLTWTAGPSQAMSYAIVLTDMSNGFVHWVLWDMPTSTLSLAAALPGTAMLTSPAGKQVHLNGAGNGYVGPCPGGTSHTYQFRIHAIDVAALPTITTASTSTAARDQVVAHSIAHGDLSGMSNAMRP